MMMKQPPFSPTARAAASRARRHAQNTRAAPLKPKKARCAGARKAGCATVFLEAASGARDAARARCQAAPPMSPRPDATSRAMMTPRDIAAATPRAESDERDAGRAPSRKYARASKQCSVKAAEHAHAYFSTARQWRRRRAMRTAGSRWRSALLSLLHDGQPSPPLPKGTHGQPQSTSARKEARRFIGQRAPTSGQSRRDRPR